MSLSFVFTVWLDTRANCAALRQIIKRHLNIYLQYGYIFMSREREMPAI